MHARGTVLLYTDADLSSPIEESAKLFAELSAGADVAIGVTLAGSEPAGRSVSRYIGKCLVESSIC